MPSTPRLKLVYIAGYGRSGTTLLSIVLGKHPELLGAGEVTELSRHAWANNTYCSCGNPLRECPFWSAVTKDWIPPDQPEVLDAYRKLQLHFENQLVMQAMDFGLGRRADFTRYVAKSEELFQHISKVSGKNIIVDSSKLPSRARALAHARNIDLYIIHMVRDGRGVAWSLMKSYKRDVKAGLQRELTPKSALRTALRWSTVNLATEQLRRVVGPERYLRVRYEDFVANPAETLAHIGNMTGIEFDNVAASLERNEALEPHHQMAGNRLRMNQSIKMSRDESWREEMPEPKRRLFERACGWLLRRYNYA
jgi:hypothetical protein